MISTKDYIEKIAKKDNKTDGDYLDSKGFLVCGKCHTRKQCDVKLFGELRRVPCNCDCKKKEIENADKATKIEKLRNEGIENPQYRDFVLSKDDQRDKSVSNFCHDYVKQWNEFSENNMGVLFYGDVGTGKSFFACAIANALINNLIPVYVTDIPQILISLQGYENEKQSIIQKIQRYPVLIIDDLGVERDTSYSAEQIYFIFNTRSKARKPLIVTTNLTMEEMKNPKDLSYKRIYERVLDMCPIQIKMAGKSRRMENMDGRKELAKKILRGLNG